MAMPPDKAIATSPAVPSRAPSEHARPQGITLRALLLGLILIPVICFWTEYTEIVAEATDLAAMSLIIGVVFALFVLVLLNLFLKRFLPRWALTQAELMFVYVMQTVSIGISGIGMMQFLNTFLGNIFYYGTPENKWKETILPFVRPWLLPKPEAVRDYYTGQSTFWRTDHILGWLSPIVVWSLFIVVLLWVMICINVILRKQWVDRERLAFPIVQLPLELAKNGGTEELFLSRQMWIGFLIPMSLETLASLNYLYPNIPFLPIKPSDPRLNLTPYFTTAPWNGVGYFALSFYPMVIGLTYFLPLDVAFSLWFFYLLTKVENVAATALGYHDPGASMAMSRTPYIGEQSAGAFLGVALIALYGMRTHLKAALRNAFLPRSHNPHPDPDVNEPLSYRTAVLGGLAGFGLLVAFGMTIGMTWYLPVFYFGLYYLYVITFTRIRAEAGLPWGYGPDMNIHQLLQSGVGSRAFALQDKVGLHLLLWHDMDFRCNASPHQLEAMKIGESSRMNLRHVAVVIVLATLVAALASWAAVLTCYYQNGAATAKVNSWRTSVSLTPWRNLKDWIDSPTKPDLPRLQGVGVGFLGTVFLMAMRARFVAWPFHPIGYAVAGTFTMPWLWCATLIGWLIKTLILRYGGMKSYRRFLPFFIGLILGDYITGSVWAIYGSIAGVRTYRAFPI